MISKTGFTLIELLIVIAIISMTMAIGLPSFQSIIASSRLTSAANAMVSALQLARIEALKQHKSVVVRSKDGVINNWAKGWDVFVDSNSNNTQNTSDTTENIFATFDALSSTITAPVGTGKGTYSSYVSYDASGRVKSAGHFLFCSATDFRAIVIAATGRIRVETADNSTRTYASECS